VETSAIQRAKPGSAGVNEGLIEVEEEKFHPLTTHQFFLSFKNLMRF